MLIRYDDDLLFRYDLRYPFAAGLKTRNLQEGNPADDIGRSDVDPDALPVKERGRCGLQHGETDIETLRFAKHSFGAHDVSPRKFIDRDAVQAHRHPLPGPRFFDRFSVDLHAPQTDIFPQREDVGLDSGDDSSPIRRSRYDRTEAGHRKGPIYRQKKRSLPGPRGDGVDQSSQFVPQCLHILAGDSGNGNDRGRFQKRSLNERTDIVQRKFQKFFVDHVLFRDDDQAVTNPKQPQNSEMLPGLGHNSLVRSHDEHDCIDARCAGHHLPNEALVPRDVDDADHPVVRKDQRRKSQLDGNAAFLFLFEPVAIHPRERFDERGLPVIDMPRGAEDERNLLL